MDLRVQFPDPANYERLADWAKELNATLTRMLQTTPEDQYPVIGLADTKASGTSGGASVAGWQDRVLNYEYDPVNICVLKSAALFEIPRGRYLVQASLPAFGSDRHQGMMWDETNATTAIWGTSEFSSGSGGTQTRSWVVGVIQPKASTVYRFRHYCQTVRAGDGLGVAVGAGTEIFTQVAIWGLT